MVIPHRVGRERDVVLGVTPRAAENGDGQDRYNDGKTPPSITGAMAKASQVFNRIQMERPWQGTAVGVRVRAGR